MSILIIGGDSKIGSHFYKYLIKKSLNVIKTSRKLQNLNESTIHFNLENPSFDDKVLEDINVVYFFASLSNINFCENNKKFSNLINYTNTKKTIKLLLKKKIKIFFISTSKVFDINSKSPNEGTNKRPQNYYAYLKLKIENQFKNNNLFIVLRLGKVLNKDFINEILDNNLFKKDSYKVNKDLYISPIHIDNLCYVMLKLNYIKNFYGNLNFCSTDSISYYELYQFIKNRYSLKKNILIKKNIYKTENTFKELMNTKKIKKIGIRVFSSKTHINKLIYK